MPERDIAGLVERLNKQAVGKDALAAEWSSREVGDKWDDEAAIAYREEAEELRQAAAALTALQQEIEELKCEVDTEKAVSKRMREQRDQTEARVWEEAAKVASGSGSGRSSASFLPMRP